ncbi:MAG: NAD-dependent epimerase/dehydratase family protein [Acidobacteriaceae bacterium]
MNILITGGAGYIGGAVTDALSKTDHHVRVYDSLLYEEAYRKPVEFAFGDVRDHDRLRSHLQWADAVIWLAALVGDGACQLNPEISVEVNQDSVKWLADNYDGRIVFMSTCSVYGAQDKVTLDERSPTDPLSVYAATKLAAEDYLTHKNAIIFRLGTIFGISDEFSRLRLDLVVNTLTVRAWRTGKITVFGGDQFRPLLHVRDAAQAAADNAATSVTGIFNLHRQNVRIVDLAYQVRNHFPDLVIEQTPMEFQDSRNYRVSSAKARESLGFSPQYSIDAGIEELKILLDANRMRDLSNPRYTNQAFLSRNGTHTEVAKRAMAEVNL